MRHAFTAFAALALSALGTAHAATVSVYTTLASWQSAVTGSVTTQDFSGYATGTNLTGVQVLPGVTLTSNIGPVEAFSATTPRASAFGAERLVGDGYYEGHYAMPFLAAALDIVSFESIPGNGTTAVDQGKMSFLFSDGTTQDIFLSGTADGSAVFIGVIADVAITSFRWNEAHEASGGNEETGLDNLRVAMPDATNQLPLPGTLPLALLALAVVPMVRRRHS